MSPRLSRSLWLAAALPPLLFLGACSGDSTSGTARTTPEDVVSFLEANASKAELLVEAFTRLVTAIAGGPADGVTLTPSGSEVAATVELDLDGDGARETSVEGFARFASPALSFAEGATLEITAIDNPSTSGTADANVNSIGIGNFLFDGSATFDAANGATVESPQFGFTVSIIEGAVFGYADFKVGTIIATMVFEPDGAGGWQFRVEGEDFESTKIY